MLLIAGPELGDELLDIKQQNDYTIKADTEKEKVDDSPPVDFSSVITQVTTPDPPNRACWDIEQPSLTKSGWRHKLKSVFCCFAPPIGYYRGYEADSTAAYPPIPVPPQPPRVYREAVIGAKRSEDLHMKTLVLDLDETLVHSSFKPIPNPDYIIPVEIDGRLVDVYVLKRPWLDHFLSTIGPRFEIVVFTASLAKYADPLLDLLDKGNVVRWRLFRESCCPYEGNYVKDLNCLGRDLSSTIIVDNSPHSYVFQPANAVPIGTFIDNMEDQELLEIMPVLLKVESVDDVRKYLGSHIGHWHGGKGCCGAKFGATAVAS
eukprot:jgi/Chrzof1/1513/Cz10g10180.t1